MKNINWVKLWDSLHSSYWFVPTIMAVSAIALAVAMLTLDRSGTSGAIAELGWIYTGGPEGARSLLSTVCWFNGFRLPLQPSRLQSLHFSLLLQISAPNPA
jgi:uncharacterized membrane protein